MVRRVEAGDWPAFALRASAWQAINKFMPKNIKYLNDSDPWYLAENIPDVIDFHFSEIWLSSFANDLEKSCGRNYKKILAIFRPKFSLDYYFGEKDSLAMEKHLIGKIKKNPEFGRLINKNIIKFSDGLNRFGQKISKIDLAKLSSEKLADLMAESDLVHTRLYEWGWLSNATDMFHGTFTSTLKKYLESKLPADLDLNEAFSLLTSPDKKSVAAKQDEEILKIASLIKNKKSAKEINRLITRHQARYFYLKYLWLGQAGVYSRDYFRREAIGLAKDGIDPLVKIRRLNQELVRIKKEKIRLFKKIKIDRRHIDLFEIYADFMLTKIYRRYAQIYWAYQIGRVLKVAACHLGISFDEIRHLTGKEVAFALRYDGLNRPALKKRLKFCWLYVEKGVELVSTDKDHPVLKFLKNKSKVSVKELTGQIGCLGKAQGRVRIINSHKDLAKMKTGDILVSIATNPDLVPAMKKAAAIVTEQGGVTSHAAIVSREMNIPCVIGTKIATQVLKDGDLVEVDANKGTVRKLK